MRNIKYKAETLLWSSIKERQNKSFIENSAKDFLINDRYIK